MSPSRQPIGGYFELELRKGELAHSEAIRLNTARSCFEYVLRARRYTKVYVPYYTCEVMLEPIRSLGIDFQFYSVNEIMEPVALPELRDNESFLYTNYFGLKQGCVERLADIYGDRLIVDNAQAFYAKPILGVDTFYSPRKFFGVSDGAFLYSNTVLEQDFPQDVSYGRFAHLLKRIDLGAEAGFEDFRNNDGSLCYQGIKWMSRLTETILGGIDYEHVKKVRRHNFDFLDKSLRSSNLLHWDLDNVMVPMVYPYLTENPRLRQRLNDNKVFVATYWPNVKQWTTQESTEYELADRLIPIPIDQRYSLDDMKTILSLIG